MVKRKPQSPDIHALENKSVCRICLAMWKSREVQGQKRWLTGIFEAIEANHSWRPVASERRWKSQSTNDSQRHRKSIDPFEWGRIEKRWSQAFDQTFNINYSTRATVLPAKRRALPWRQEFNQITQVTGTLWSRLYQFRDFVPAISLVFFWVESLDDTPDWLYAIELLI